MIRNFSRHDASAVKYVLWPAGSTLFGRTVSQRFPPLTPSHRSVCTTGLVRANIVSPHIKGKQPNKYSLWKTKGHVDNDHKETKKCPDKNKLLRMAYKYTKRKLFLKYFVAMVTSKKLYDAYNEWRTSTELKVSPKYTQVWSQSTVTYQSSAWSDWEAETLSHICRNTKKMWRLKF